MSDRRLVLACFAGPVAWFTQLSVKYLLVATWCPSRVWLVLVSLAMFAIAAWGLVVTLRTRRENEDPQDDVARRRRSLATVGAISATFFVFLLVIPLLPLNKPAPPTRQELSPKHLHLGRVLAARDAQCNLSSLSAVIPVSITTLRQRNDATQLAV